MTFFDWWGFLGTGIQSIFAWIAFNRDGFADNVSWRQAQKYQQKNYNISWIAIARDDIRDMMGISIHRINNYMIVATLILSVAAGALLSVSFSPECPGFIVFAFYLCTGISLMFLMESIMFGVKGQNSAFTNTMKLLTYQVRPENPAEYSHDYMKQSQWVERNGLSALFRIPGILPSYDTDSGQDKTKGLKDYVEDIVEESRSSFHYGGNAKGRPKIAEKKRTHLGSKATGNFDEDDINLEEATPLESLVMRTSHTWYLSKFAEFMRLWHPYDMYAKYSMGLGILCLGHSSAYFALGYLSVQGYYLTEYAATVITFAFIFMVVLIIQSTFSAPRRFVRIAAVLGVSLGPACATIAAVVVSDVAKQILVPAAYASHFLLWVLVYYVAHQMPDSHTHFIRPGEGFWSNKHKKKEKNNQDPPSDRGHPPDLESEPQESQDSHHRWKKQEEHYHQEWRRNLPTMSKTQYLEQSPCARSSLRALTCGNGNLPCDGPSAIPEEPEPKPQGEGSFKDYQDECKSQRGDVVGWPTDEDEFSINAEKTKSHIKSTAHCTILATICLWLAMVIWSILTYWFAPYEVPAMYLELARPPQVQWPSASFRPRLLACKEPIAVMSDGYKLFEFDLASESTKPISCPGLRGRVSDVSLSCTPEGCVPVALAGNRVVHCKSGPMTVQDSLAQFTVLGDGARREAEEKARERLAEAIQEQQQEIEQRKQELKALQSAHDEVAQRSQVFQEEQRKEAARAEEERARVAEEAQKQEEQLAQKRAELKTLEEHRAAALQNLEEEERIREEKDRLAKEEAARREEEAQKRHQELERRKTEIKQLEADQQEAARLRLEEEQKREQELQRVQKALQEECEELQRQRAEQQEAQQKAQEEHQTRAKDLEEQQAQLEAQRHEVETCRARGEAERQTKLEELKEHEEELQRHREQLQQQKLEDEELRKAQAETFQLLDQELQDRAQDISCSEQALVSERQQILRSRGQLAMVQAHVVSLLGKDKHGEPGKPASHILADEPEAELDAPEGEEMWNMDWSAVTASQTQQEAQVA